MSPRLANFLDRHAISLALMVLLLIGLSTWLTGCTVVPAPVPSSVPSFDGNQQNSGFLGYNPDNSGHITANAAQRYQMLVALGYGRLFTPQIRGDFGLTKRGDGTYDITAQALVDFAVMQAQLRQGALPPVK